MFEHVQNYPDLNWHLSFGWLGHVWVMEPEVCSKYVCTAIITSMFKSKCIRQEGFVQALGGQPLELIPAFLEQASLHVFLSVRCIIAVSGTSNSPDCAF